MRRLSLCYTLEQLMTLAYRVPSRVTMGQPPSPRILVARLATSSCPSRVTSRPSTSPTTLATYSNAVVRLAEYLSGTADPGPEGWIAQTDMREYLVGGAQGKASDTGGLSSPLAASGQYCAAGEPFR